MSNLTEGQIELANALHDVGAVKLRGEGEPGFKLKIHQTNPDAPLSPIFFQLRTPDNTTHGDGPLTPEVVDQIGEELHARIDRADVHPYDHVAGIPNAGVPLADAYARASSFRGEGVSQLTLHKEGDLDTRRIGEQVDGPYLVGDWAVVVDDLVTHAKTKLEAVYAVRGAGLNVEDLAVLIDREQGGAKELEKHDVETHAVFTLSELLELYLSEGRITPQQYQEINDYLREDAG